MTSFHPNPVTIKVRDDFEVQQSGGTLNVVGANAVSVGLAIMVSEIEANPNHFLRRGLAQFRSHRTVAVLPAQVGGATTYIGITEDEWALGADERARYAAWSAECVSAEQDRQAAERKFDAMNNEGGEGYNPHRSGSAPTYRRSR